MTAAKPRNELHTFGEINFVKVPTGEFMMGSDSYGDETPYHKVNIPYDYFIGRYPLSWEQYKMFGDISGEKVQIPSGKDDHPVTNVRWNEAQDYILWLNSTYGEDLPEGLEFCLPSEAEWEKAARGPESNEYPWGERFEKELCNTSNSQLNGTTKVGKYSPKGDSVYGAADMAGNIYEWTQSLYKPYPYDQKDGRENLVSSGDRVPRGGSWFDSGTGSRSAYRFYNYYPKDWLPLTGFRVAIAPR